MTKKSRNEQLLDNSILEFVVIANDQDTYRIMIEYFSKKLIETTERFELFSPLYNESELQELIKHKEDYRASILELEGKLAETYKDKIACANNLVKQGLNKQRVDEVFDFANFVIENYTFNN